MSFKIRLQNLCSALASSRCQCHDRRRGALRAAALPPSLEVLEDRYLFSLSPAATYDVGPNPRDVVTADFNNDSQLDLATANPGSHSVSVLLGDGGGGFGAAIESAGTNDGFDGASMTVADFNNDGHFDLATAMSLYLSDGTAYGSLDIWLGNGDGTFQSPTKVFSGGPPLAVAAGDFNNDGNSDLVVTADAGSFSNGYILLALGNGQGGFSLQSVVTGGPDGGLAVGDLNGDGNLDAITIASNSGDAFLGNGAGGLFQTHTFLSTSYSLAVAVGDFTGDGIHDLVISGGPVEVFTGLGDGTFNEPIVHSASGYEHTGVAAADFNADGKLDLVVSNASSDPYSAGAVSVLLGQGDGSFDLPITVATGGIVSYSVVMGDFNGDGRPDVAAANALSNTISVLLNDGVWRSPDVPSLNISDATVTEGNTGTASATFTLTLSSTSAVDVTVHYATADGSAMAGNDYEAKAGTATIAAGQTSTTVAVAVLGDTRKEANETFFMNLSGAVGGLIADAQGAGTILNDDGPPKKMNRHDAALMALNFGRLTDATEDDGDFTGDGRVDLADLAYLQVQLDDSASSRVTSPSAVIASSGRARATHVAVATRQIDKMFLRANTRKSAEAVNRDLEREFNLSPRSATMVDSDTLFAARVRRAQA